MMEETWRAVPGYEGWYEVSSEGRLRSIGLPKRGCARRNEPRPIVLTPLLYRRGYLKYSLGTCDGATKARRMFAHRIVYEAFHGPIPRGLTVNHIDGDKSNNRPSNLETATYLEQSRHARSLGLSVHIREGRLKKADLTADDASEIRRLYAAGDTSQMALAKRYGTTQTNVSSILRRLTWRDV